MVYRLCVIIVIVCVCVSVCVRVCICMFVYESACFPSIDKCSSSGEMCVCVCVSVCGGFLHGGQAHNLNKPLLCS